MAFFGSEHQHAIRRALFLQIFRQYFRLLGMIAVAAALYSVAAFPSPDPRPQIPSFPPPQGVGNGQDTIPKPSGFPRDSIPTNPFDTTNQNRNRDRGLFPTGNDSLFRRLSSGMDSLGRNDSTVQVLDTTYVVYQDSTERMDQFKLQRQDAPAAPFFPGRRYPLFLDTKSPAYTRDVQLDSTGRFVTVREMVNGQDVKVPVTLPVDEYIKQRFEEEKRNNWRSMVYEYQIRKKGDDLAGLLGNITNISIPVPSNPLLSIFGRNVINLHVTGQVDIRAAFKHQASDQQSQNFLDQSQSAPDFNQDVQIAVNGTVGDKLNINADWNTQRTFEYENQLKIRYQGYDDEIVKSVEAGNVSLSGTPSLVGGGQALFGIKANLQAGPLSLTTLLSQKKGQSKEVTISGGSSERPMEIQPKDYSQQYYFLDINYRNYFEDLYSSVIPRVTPGMQDSTIVDIDVWITTLQTQGDPSLRRQAFAYIDLPAHADGEKYGDQWTNKTRQSGDGTFEDGWWVKLDRSKYKINPVAGFISLKDVVDQQAIAVAYRITNAPNGKVVFGDMVTDTAGGRMTVLKLVKPKQLLPTYDTAWKLQMKNIYNIGADVKKDGFKLNIVYRPPSGAEQDNISGINLLQAFKFDRYASDNATPTPDGVFDFLPGVTIDQQRGDIIFPYLQPFDTATTPPVTSVNAYFRANHVSADSILYPEIYTTAKTGLNTIQRSSLVIKVVASTAQQSRIPLGAFNIVEGSVQVLLNGSPLTAGEDYQVDYIVGEVTLRSERALAPGANLSIKYEQNDLFQLASKTLIGARATLDLPAGAALGFTVMSLNQASLSDKVRLGEEPTKNTIMGMDGGFKANLPLLTDLLGYIPMLHAREMSFLDFKGEVAYMKPDPNTRKSTVASDNNSSIAYLDDFEGARRTIPLTISYTGWSPASPPVYSPLDTNHMRPARERMYDKAMMMWYNNATNFDPVKVTDIWPNKSVRTEDQFVTLLYLDYNPSHRGTYNFSPNLDSSLHRAGRPYDDKNLRRKNWNGVQRYISTLAGDLVSQNVNYLELWVNTRQKDGQIDPEDLKHGRMFVDLGRVSEDVIPNDSLNSEDIIKTTNNPLGIPNGRVQQGADLGLDMMSDGEEQSHYRAFMASNPNDPDIDPNDPAGDDYSYTTGGTDFAHFNGTELNYERQSPAGRYPDTEDLNGNGALDVTDNYLEYEIPLDSTYIDSNQTTQQNPYIVGGDREHKWYQIRVPLRSATRVIAGTGQTTEDILRNVQYIRMWVSGFEKPIVVRLAEVDLVGNQWAEETKGDSVMKVSVVNYEDNPTYSIPPGVIREQDRTRPDQVVYGNEQSLDLVLNGLAQGQSRSAVKLATGRAADVFNYKTMKMFIHGDPTFTYTPAHHDAEVYIRFGSDDKNYYEYRMPVKPDWFEMTIDFGQLTAVKTARDRDTSARVDSLYRSGNNGIRGRPALTQIRYLAVGVENPPDPNGRPFLNGEVWVNELRVIDVDNSPGYAYHFDTQLKLSDIATVSLNLSQRDPNFHTLEERFGTRVTQQSWAVNTAISVDKYFPQEMQGSTLAMTYSHQENMAKPKYLPGTDILVSQAATEANSDAVRRGRSGKNLPGDSITTISQTLHTGDSYSFGNIKIILPWKAWYINETFNKLSYRFNYARSSDRSPTVASNQAWSWNFGMSYGNTITSDVSIQPFKSIFNGLFFLDAYKEWKIYFLPFTNFSANIDAQRSRSTEVNRQANVPVRDARTFTATKSFGFGWRLTEGGLLNLGGDYGLTLGRDLLYLDNDTAGRGFGSILHSIFIGGRDGTYGQRVTVNSKPKLPNILDITKYFDVTFGYNTSYDWRNLFQQGDLGKSARWSNNINVTSTLRLKSLTDPWFAPSGDETADRSTPAPPPPRALNDTSKAAPHDTTGAARKGKNVFATVKAALRYFIKIPLLDYETISISFTEQNGMGSSGIIGGTGFKNFWGRLPFTGSNPADGPSRLYQLGLASDPSGTLNFRPSGKFPFIGWEQGPPGLRAPNGNLNDQFTQANNIALRTTRPLWEGATLEINWKVGWQFSKNSTLQTDSFGVPSIKSIQTAGRVERSYLSLPPVLLFKYLGGGLEKVGKRYQETKDQAASPEVALANAFEDGMESLPWLKQILGAYAPRANWSLRWDGLQKLSFLGSAFKNLTLDHAYQSTFSKDYRGNADGTERTDLERVSYGFSPLVGLTGTPKDLLGGNITVAAKYGTTTSYDLNLSSQNITETGTQDISFSLTYGSHGFSLPIFGVNLTNDVDITFTYSRAKNSRKLFDPSLLAGNAEGTPLEGTTRTTMEPRVRYTLSQRVSASVFYRYLSTAPDQAGGSTIFGTSTNEAGVDIHIAIQ